MAKKTANEQVLHEEGLIRASQFLSHHKTSIPGIPHEQTEADERIVKNKDPFLKFGTDNLFPQHMARLNRRAGSHRSILRSKKVFTTGKGFAFDESNAFLSEFVAMANGEDGGKSLRKVFGNLSSDHNSQGNAYMEIITDGVRSFIAVAHRDATTGRVGKNRDRILFHPKWELYRRSKDLIKELPLYPEFEMQEGFLRSVFHYKEYEPEFTDYGIPGWIASMDAAGIAYKTNKWNVSRLDNSFQTSGVLMIDGKLSQEDAIELKAEAKKEFAGEKNQGNVMFIVKQLGGGGTTFTPINEGTEGDWIKLHSQSDQDLITAHNWFRSLSGLAEPGKLGNTQQIRNEYHLAKETVIEDDQEFLLEPIQRILLDEMGVDASSLQLINKSPISILDTLNPNKFTEKNEARKMAGLEELDEDDERGNEMVDTGNSPTTVTLE